jgi:hypothetical protein
VDVKREFMRSVTRLPGYTEGVPLALNAEEELALIKAVKQHKVRVCVRGGLGPAPCPTPARAPLLTCQRTWRHAG